MNTNITTQRISPASAGGGFYLSAQSEYNLRLFGQRFCESPLLVKSRALKTAASLKIKATAVNIFSIIFYNIRIILMIIRLLMQFFPEVLLLRIHNLLKLRMNRSVLITFLSLHLYIE